MPPSIRPAVRPVVRPAVPPAVPPAVRRLTMSLAVVVMSLFATGNLACAPTLAPVYRPSTNVGLDAKGQPYSPEQVEQAILRGLSLKKWFVVQREPGSIVAENSAGGHSAQVRIVYGAAGFQILHVQSTPGLKHGSDARHGEIIHRRYNHWVNRLDQTIRDEMRAVSFLPHGQAAPIVVPPPAPVHTPETAPAPAPAAPTPAPAPLPAPTPAPAPAPN